MKYKFKSGAAVEGSAEQILEMAKALGEIVELKKLEGDTPEGYYLSEAHGLTKIADMPDFHIRNALLKMSKVFFEKLSAKHRTLSNKEFLDEYVTLTDNKTVVDLYTELSKRVK